MNYVLMGIAFVAMLGTTFLRGFQNKNVAAGYKKLAFICGALMAGLDGTVILMLANAGTAMVPFTALGAGAGWVLGMVVHDRIMAKVKKEAKAKKRERRRREIERTVKAMHGQQF